MRSLCPWNYCPNPCDAIHIALGSALAFIPGKTGAAGSAVFLGYELLRSKPMVEKLRSLAQFGLGYALAEALPQIWRSR